MYTNKFKVTSSMIWFGGGVDFITGECSLMINSDTSR